MVRQVDEDARGILDPQTGLRHFHLRRFAPAPDIARLVERYWLASWDLTEPYTQHVLPHPVVNLVFRPEGSVVNGIATRVQSRRLVGRSWALGVMFRPAGFRPVAGRAMSALRDAEFGVDEVFGAEGAERAGRMTAILEVGERIAAVERFLRGLLPEEHDPAEDTAALVEWVAGAEGVTRVEQVARRAGVSVRRLQRRFADHVGIGPKAVIRRYRLYAAAERARRGGEVRWGEVAAALGYSDQPHLIRDFAATFGMTPARYASG